MYAINHGLAPSFKSALMSDLQKSDVHTYSFDENLNEVTQTCEMDLHLHNWDVNKNLVQSRYYGSRLLGHATHTDLLNYFRDIIKELPLTNLFQISMDGTNVNSKFFKEFSANFNSNCSHSLIDMETCNLHVVHWSLKTYEVASEWGLKKSWKPHTLSSMTVQREEKVMQVLAQLSIHVAFVLLDIKSI